MTHKSPRLLGIASSPIEVPTWFRQFVSVVATASAAILYAVVLGVAIHRTLTESDPVFSETMTRAAAALSGLVGSVVTAGFARSGSGVSVHVAGIDRDLITAPIDGSNAIFRAGGHWACHCCRTFSDGAR